LSESPSSVSSPSLSDITVGGAFALLGYGDTGDDTHGPGPKAWAPSVLAAAAVDQWAVREAVEELAGNLNITPSPYTIHAETLNPKS